MSSSELCASQIQVFWSLCGSCVPKICSRLGDRLERHPQMRGGGGGGWRRGDEARVQVCSLLKSVPIRSRYRWEIGIIWESKNVSCIIGKALSVLPSKTVLQLSSVMRREMQRGARTSSGLRPGPTSCSLCRRAARAARAFASPVLRSKLLNTHTSNFGALIRNGVRTT